MTNTNLLKARMVEHGDNDYISKLAALLNISRTTASNKLNNNTQFNQEEIALVAQKYNLSAEEIKNIFIGGD